MLLLPLPSRALWACFASTTAPDSPCEVSPPRLRQGGLLPRPFIPAGSKELRQGGL